MRKRMIMMIMGVALMALPIMAQSFRTTQAEQPNAAFHSTSVMVGSGSQYSSNPMLNTDGTAAYNDEPTTYSPAQAPQNAGPRKLPGNPQPIGDAVLPLMLMAGAFGMFVYFRRKRSAA